jgi:predicted transposase YbfD/YdcC
MDATIGLSVLAMVASHREIGNKVSQERHYCLCSRHDLSHFARHSRAHWWVENTQPWVFGCTVW